MINLMGFGSFKTGSLEISVNGPAMPKARLSNGTIVLRGNDLYEVERRIFHCSYCGDESWKIRPIELIGAVKRYLGKKAIRL